MTPRRDVMHLTIDSTVQLNDGAAMPRFGLGVYQISGSRCTHAVTRALEIGYHHIDTAALYGNEAEVGRAVRESAVPRERVFITTKLWNSDQGFESAIRAGEKSLKAVWGWNGSICISFSGRSPASAAIRGAR